MTGRITTWRAAAAAAAVLTIAAVLGLPQTAYADSVVTQSQNSVLEMSTTSAPRGGTVAFTLTVTNTTNRSVSAAQDFRPSARIFTSTASSACNVVSGPAPSVCVVQPTRRNLEVNWGQGSSDRIPANSTAKVTVTTRVSAGAAPGTYTITPSGRVGATTSTFTPATFTFEVTARADIAVGLTATPGPLASTAIDYTQTTTNNGPSTAATGTITTALPSQTTGVTGLPGKCTYNSTAKTVACTLTALPNGSTATNTFTAQFGLLTSGPLPATATRTTSSPTDPNTANDTATATCRVLTGLIVRC